jgi:Family of unknown function (DUF6113)
VRQAGAVRQEAERAASYALVVALSLLTAVWGAFLVPLRVGGVPVPLSVVVAAGANVALGVAGGRLYGRLGAAVPGVLWFVVVATMANSRPEGDLVVVQTTTGLLFLLIGSICAAVPVGTTPPAHSRPGAGAPPAS